MFRKWRRRSSTKESEPQLISFEHNTETSLGSTYEIIYEWYKDTSPGEIRFMALYDYAMYKELELGYKYSLKALMSSYETRKAAEIFTALANLDLNRGKLLQVEARIHTRVSQNPGYFTEHLNAHNGYTTYQDRFTNVDADFQSQFPEPLEFFKNLSNEALLRPPTRPSVNQMISELYYLLIEQFKKQK